jgi:peptidoglycan endopeptidase LytE
VKQLKTFLAVVVFGMVFCALPLAAHADTYYEVKAGDTLWNISMRHGTTVERIQVLNNISGSLIYPGQSLLIARDGEAAAPGEASPAVDVSRGTSRSDTIISYAKTFIGVPYVYGGTSPSGFDCSGYVQYVFNQYGISLPRTADAQYYAGTRVSIQEARLGDIVAFAAGGGISHTGIYLGGSSFISATSSRGVQIADIYGPYWGDHFYGISRVLP